MNKSNLSVLLTKIAALKKYDAEEFLELINSFKFLSGYDFLGIIILVVKTFARKNNTPEMIKMIYILSREYHQLALEALLADCIEKSLRDLSLSVCKELKRDLTLYELNQLIQGQLELELFNVAKETAILLPIGFSTGVILKIKHEETKN